MKTTTVLAAMLAITLGLSTPCLAQQLRGVTAIEVKNIALKQCLRDNYNKITPGGDNPLNHDLSYLMENLALGSIADYKTRPETRYWELQEYVANAGKNFHKDTLSWLKGEPHIMSNTIFEQCMDFYASPELDAFVHQRIMDME